MDFSFNLEKKDKKTQARAGIINTPHGKIKTPAFSPVATKASVKGLTPNDLKETKSQVVLGNAYHLYLRPGTETIEKFGGFAPFMGWNGPTITDSGGYQVSFLFQKPFRERDRLAIQDRRRDEELSKVSITDYGMYFRSHIDGGKQFISPEKSIEIQRVLGADIIMAFDQPLSKGLTLAKKKEAIERTLKWEERSFKEWDKSGKKSIQGKYQALFGIVQGGTNRSLSRQSLKFILETGFPGIAVGGDAIGEDPKMTATALDTVSDQLPDDKPVHALGLGGGPEGVFEAVERGVDLFDNSSVTRMARTGLLFIYPEDGGNKQNKFRINIEKSIYKDDKKPISKICGCLTCRTFSKAYIHHLLVSDEPLGVRLTTIHNVYFYNDLMKKIRKTILEDDFLSLKKYWIDSK